MITALAEPHKNYLHVVFKFPDLKSLEINIPGNDPGKLLGEAKRRLYFEIRKYIIAKLRSWLRQRMFAFHLTDRAKCSQEAASLLVLLGYYEDRSCFKLYELVINNRAVIETLAPSEGSAHYGFYSKSILPILDFCDEMKG
jgi:hypothetical protein